MKITLTLLLLLTLFSFNQCDNPAEPKDCFEVTNGNAFVDDCGVCVGGDSGLIENYLMDCAGICGGTAYEDECSTCDDNADNDCQQDCAGTWGGSAIVDDCGVCSGDDTGHESNSDMDCAQECFGIHVVDDCSQCVLPEDYNISMDCFGTCFGIAFENECGCVDGETGLAANFCYGCTDLGADNYNPDATVNDGSCAYSCIDIDGNSYEAVQIGNQLWMAENLKVTHYNNGDPIPTEYSNMEWSFLLTGAYAVYSWNADGASQETCGGNCTEVYGSLYNWYAVDDDRGICPEGFHAPSDDEWQQLADYLGDTSFAGGLMKSTGTIEAGTGLWFSPNSGASNSSGFTAHPGGYRFYSYNYAYGAMGGIGYFWTSTAFDNSAQVWKLYDGSSGVHHEGSWKRFGFSVRCIGDQSI